MIKEPLISVIVPVFNGDRYIGAALESAFKQDYRPIEIIVVDDGSTDYTAEVAQSFEDVIYIHQSNQGVAAARNVGISVAEGEFIAFLDADDLWTQEKLTIKFRNFLEKRTKRPAWLKEEQLVEDQMGGVPNLVVRKSVFEEVGVFDANCRSGSDLDWVIRTKDAKIRGATLPHILLYRRIHDLNLSYKWRGGRGLLLKSLKSSIDRQRACQREEDRSDD